MAENLTVVKKFCSIGLKLVSLGLVISAGSFWAAAGVESRPKYRDEQTLVGGAVWSQILIPIGLLISKQIDDELDKFLQGYFMVTGMCLLMATGLFLIIGESLTLAEIKRLNRQVSGLQNIFSKSDMVYDKMYLWIGILTLLAGLFTLADFMMLLTS